jgi:hypothetical protein
MKIKSYIKKPLPVWAIQFVGDNIGDIIRFIGDFPHRYVPIENIFIISTLEGDHIVRHGDYVVKGIYDEFYPVKPTIFEETYTLVDENI